MWRSVFLSLALVAMTSAQVGPNPSELIMKIAENFDNLCDGHPPTECACVRESQGPLDEFRGPVVPLDALGENIIDDNDLDILPVQGGFPPPCIGPKYCLCSDGTEVSPTTIPLPDRVLSKINEKIEKVRAKALFKLNTLCSNDGGEPFAPESCECSGFTQTDVILRPYTKPAEVGQCLPIRCDCDVTAGEDWVDVNPFDLMKDAILSIMCRAQLNPLNVKLPEKLEGGVSGLPNLFGDQDDVDLTPISIKCKDESILEPPFDFTLMELRACEPQEVTCPPLEEGGENLVIEEPLTAIKERLHASFLNKFKDVASICPNDEIPTECSCAADPEMTLKFPPQSPLDVMVCQPDLCQCPDGSEVKIQAPTPIRKIKEFCGSEDVLPDYCTCENGDQFDLTPESDEDLPYLPPALRLKINLRKMLKECKPTSCRCPGEEEDKILTIFGCEAGGLPRCPDNEKLSCGEDILTIRDFVKADVKRQCICPDNNRPVCFDSKTAPLCPNGSEVNHELGDIFEAISRCK